MQLAISIQNMGFHYAENSGVMFKGFNLKVEQGERFGLFGPNGAGKTTLMNLIAVCWNIRKAAYSY